MPDQETVADCRLRIAEWRAYPQPATRNPQPLFARPRAATLRGFTLLELVIVIAIFAVFSLMAYGGLDAVLKTRRDVETALDRLAQVQKAYLRLRNDLQQVRFRPARDVFGDVQPALRSGDRAYLEFTRGGWRNPLYQPRPSFERVAYRHEDGQLIRVSWRVLDQAQDSKPVETVLLDRVEEVRWQFLDDGRQWQGHWPLDAADRMPYQQPPPMAVEASIRTADLGELRFLFRLGSAALNLPQQAPPGGSGTGAGQ